MITVHRRGLADYDKCAQRQGKMVDRDTLSLETEKALNQYTKSVVQSLRWTCFGEYCQTESFRNPLTHDIDFTDNNCDNQSLLQKLEHCDDIIQIGVLPSIRMSNASELVKACRYAPIYGPVNLE